MQESQLLRLGSYTGKGQSKKAIGKTITLPGDQLVNLIKLNSISIGENLAKYWVFSHT